MISWVAFLVAVAALIVASRKSSRLELLERMVAKLERDKKRHPEKFSAKVVEPEPDAAPQPPRAQPKKQSRSKRKRKGN